MHGSALGTWFTDFLRQIVKRCALLAFLICGMLLSLCAPAKAQISPRHLSKAHSSLNGTTQCNSCRQFGASTPTYECLECHKEVART